MNIFLTIIQILSCIGLIISILMQSAKSAGMGGVIAGGAETFFGKKGMDSLLAKVATFCGAIFFIITLILVLL